MKLFNTLLRKIKYNLRYLFGAKISIPSEFKLFERRKTNYEKFINTYCKPSPEDEVNLNDSLKITVPSLGGIDKFSTREGMINDFKIVSITKEYTLQKVQPLI